MHNGFWFPSRPAGEEDPDRVVEAELLELDLGGDAIDATLIAGNELGRWLMMIEA
jgi:hypothetical protein